MATFKSSGTNKDVKIQPTGTGKVVVGTGAAAATVASDGDNDLVLQTGNATTGSITVTDGANGDIILITDGSGKVGIGTTTPESGYKLDVAGWGTFTHPAGDCVVKVQTGNTTGTSFLYFGDTDDADVGYLGYQHNSDDMYFGTNATTRMRIDSSGNVRADKFANLAGTGAPDFPQGLTNNNSLVYSRSNILDTVSQSAGIPTGGIIERGSNSNGEYVKFADGTLICTQIIPGVTNTATTLITGATVYYVEVTWNFPVAFASATDPVVVVSGSDSNGSNATLNGSATTTSATIWIYKASNSNTVQCNAIAIGRWY